MRLIDVCCVLLWLVVFRPHSACTQCCTNGANLLANYNPDFSIEGNPIPPGFVNDNVYSVTLGSGYYSVIVSRDYGACFGTPQYDHTYGDATGDYLWFDTGGSASPTNPEVAWMPFDPNRPPGEENTIDVVPNTTYVFSVWIRDLAREPDCVSGGAPVMGLRINGVDMAEIDLADYTSPCCPPWVYLCSEWNSGNATGALIQIESRSGVGWTDLGIDDVYFGTTFTFQEGVLGNDIISCQSQSVVLTAPDGAEQLTWSTGATTESITVTTPGIYWADIVQAGCSGRDSIEVLLGNAAPVISLGDDVESCQGSIVQLQAATNQSGTVTWNTGASGGALNVLLPGVYFADIVNDCGTDRDSILVTFVGPPEVIVNPATATICAGQSITLSATPAGSPNVLWSNGSTQQTIQVNTPGVYQVSVTNGCGTATEEVEVSALLSPVAILGADIIACVGESVVLSLGNTADAILWSTGSTSAAITALESGEYRVTVANGCGEARDSVLVEFIQPPIFSLGNDTTLCSGEQLWLRLPELVASIAWNTGSTNDSLLVDSAGIYSAVMDNGCVYTDSIEVQSVFAPVMVLPDTLLLCEEREVTLEAFTTEENVQWSTGETGTAIEVGTTGVYIAVVSNACGLNSDSTLVLAIASFPQIVLPDTLLCSEELWTIDLSQLEGAWTWADNHPALRVIGSTGTYTLVAQDVCGEYEERFSVRVRPCNCAVYAPNAVTPNNDGVNDVWSVVSECAFESFELFIFNRWGERIFQSNTSNPSWLAGYQSYYVPDGIYTFQINYQFIEGDPEQTTGTIAVMR